MKIFKIGFRLFIILSICTHTFHINAQRQMESLNRGLVAIKVSNGVFTSWRVLGTEWKNVSYNLYRDSTRLNATPLTGATCYLDPGGTIGSSYTVTAVINDIEQPASELVDVWGQNYKTIPLQRPAGGTTPDGGSFTYNANDCSVADLDGDGEYEIVLKWDPSNAKDNSQSGYTGNVCLDGYELDGTKLWRIDLGINIRAGAHYTQFMVYDLDGDGKAEVACKTADGTVDGTGNIIGDEEADYRNSSGYILAGPEFLTIFNGETGEALVTTNYDPPRGSVSSWGDSYGNRVDRFLACIAYLDGQHPSLVMCRGYYTRTVLVAWDWRNETLTKRWVFDSNNGYASYAGQGNHNLSVADVDDDGKDEIIYGACAIDDDGTGLWTTGLGHGDAMHVSDIDPGRPGLERWGIHEGTGNPGSALLDARTGEIIWQTPNADVGRGVSADLTASFPGMECWGGTSGLRSCRNEYTGGSPSSTNHIIWWDGDDLRELLNGTSITKYNGNTLLSAAGCSSNNGTKSNPAIQADILGDWREEVIFRTSDNTALRLYVSTYSTERRLYTLMHDPQYRLSIAWQNVAYNQPPHTGFFLGNGMESAPPPPFTEAKLRWSEGTTWDVNISKNWFYNDTLTYFNDGDGVLFDISGSNSNPIILNGTLSPSVVTVYSPKDYTFNGPGSLSGTMDLLKTGSGTLIINTDNDYTGETTVWDGTLFVNGSLSQSMVEVHRFSTIGGNGRLGNGLTVQNGGNIIVSDSLVSADTLRISDHLTAGGDVTMFFDLSDDTSGVSKTNDLMIIDGDINLTGTNTIQINMLDGALQTGHYTLMSYSGSFNGNIDHIKIKGLTGIPYDLKNIDGALLLKIIDVRDPALIIWTGASGNDWDLARSINWLNNGIPDWFVSNDTVLFDDSAGSNTDVNLADQLYVGKMLVDASADYSFGGSGSIGGSCAIIKSGSGKLSIEGENDYTGATIINGGTLEIPGVDNAVKPNPIGAASADPGNFIINGAIVSITGSSSTTDRGLTLNDAGGTLDISKTSTTVTLSGELTGNGKLVKTGAGTLSLSGINTYSGGTMIKEGMISLGSDNANIWGLGTGLITIENGTLEMLDNSNSYTDNCNWDIMVPTGSDANLKLDSRCSLTGSLAGSGTLNVYTPYIRSELLGNWSEFAGNINVTTDADGGTFILGNDAGYGNTSINLNNNVTAIFRHTVNDTIIIGDLSGTSGSVLGAGGEGSTTITWRIGSKNTNSTFNGVISDVQYKNSGAKASIIKTGSGIWTLTNANTYTGNTLVDSGMLVINNMSGSGTGTDTVTVNSGANLSGYGAISGEVIITENASLSVTKNDLGTLTVNNNVTILPGGYFAVLVDPADKTSGMLKVTGKLRLGGILYMINEGAGIFAPGDSYKILDASACSGQFDLIIPLTPGKDLKWDTTGLAATGVIRIVTATGVNDPLKSDLSIVIYPIPASDRFYVEFPETIDNVSVIVENLSGQSIYSSIELNTSCFEIDLSGFIQGIYVLRLKTNNGLYVRKIFKE